VRLHDLEQMFAVEVDHWWFAGKRMLFRRLLERRLAAPGLRILDVGSGTGAVPSDFSRYGWICASDRSLDAMRFARSRGVRVAAVSDAAVLPIKSGSVDLVIAFDVIEHVDDDRAMLAELKRVLKPGGAVAIHVPAWPSLWSRHDELLHHKRRYTRRALRRLIEEGDFEVEYLGWASAAILPPAFVLRGVERITGSRAESADIYPVPRPVNATLRGVYRVETAIAASVGLPFGLSLAAIAARS
jgi:ubiquinone/menaquinone biosynthesis C-methylase UbiE